ncbi:MAG: rhomboid family intramembrane serine protease [Gammaproteobacteria bacterium]|nr:rhomboid family intramembrane serine protease [Gammaproteobacteria bacterium]
MAKHIEWHNNDVLPSSDRSREWQVLEHGKASCYSEDELKSSLRRWAPGRLVAPPDSQRFTPPVAVPLLAEQVCDSVRQRGRQLVLAFGLPALIMFLLYLLEPARDRLGMTVILTGLAIMFGIDHSTALRDERGIDERSRFIYWLHTAPRPRKAFITSILFVSTIGLGQLVLASLLEHPDDVFYRYGFMYTAVLDGEVWRALTGPLLHYSFLHFLTNFLFITLVGTLSCSLIGWLATWGTFLLGCIFGAFGQALFRRGSPRFHCGISCGVYGVAGMLAVAPLIGLRRYPKGFWIIVPVSAASESLAPSSRHNQRQQRDT